MTYDTDLVLTFLANNFSFFIKENNLGIFLEFLELPFYEFELGTGQLRLCLIKLKFKQKFISLSFTY